MILSFVLQLAVIILFAALYNVKKNKIARFILFAFPCYWVFAVLFIVLVLWKVGFDEPDLVPVALVGAAIIVAALLLVKKYYWISFPMIVLGIYIAMQEDQFIGHLLHLFGAYMILHYVACGLYIHKKKTRLYKLAGMMEEYK